MNSARIFNRTAVTILAAFCGACSSSSTDAGPGAAGRSPAATTPACLNATQGASSSLITTSTTNVLPLYIADHATTGSIGYSNEPLVSVTICTPGHTDPSQCQTISNILLDTGSYGLRVFSTVIASNVSLVQQTINYQGETLKLAECAEFGTGADWGPVQNADVLLGNQTATNIPIQVIDSTFGVMPAACAALNPDTDPCAPDAGFNGILGVGIFAQDCGADCGPSAAAVDYIGQYLGCDASQCFNAAQDGSVMEVPTAKQVVNPVAALASASFNNGISITLPAISAAGASEVAGTFTIGIGAGASNVPGAVGVFPADVYGATDGKGADFLTIFNGDTYGTTVNGKQAFLDSGSNALYMPTAAGLTLCSDSADFYCPASAVNLSATIEGYFGVNGGPGTPAAVVNFSIGNADALSTSSHSAFNNIGGPAGSIAGFDWGLPFFFGRTVYVGIAGKTATIDTVSKVGPYWAF